jgi:hypothetical protein
MIERTKCRVNVLLVLHEQDQYPKSTTFGWKTAKSRCTGIQNCPITLSWTIHVNGSTALETTLFASQKSSRPKNQGG